MRIAKNWWKYIRYYKYCTKDWVDIPVTYQYIFDI